MIRMVTTENLERGIMLCVHWDAPVTGEGHDSLKQQGTKLLAVERRGRMWSRGLSNVATHAAKVVYCGYCGTVREQGWMKQRIRRQSGDWYP